MRLYCVMFSFLLMHSAWVSGKELPDTYDEVPGSENVEREEPDISSDTVDSEEPDSVAPDNILTVDAQLMSRGEIRRGGLPSVDDVSEKRANFVLERTRLSIDYKREWLNVRLTAQHTSVWGQKGNGTLTMHEAWARLHSRQGLFLQLGRQNLNYDDERILGSNDWSMTALTHDALRFGYEGYGHKIHGVLAYNQRAENINGGTTYTTTDGTQPYKTMQTLWYHYDLPRFPLSFSLLFMNTGVEMSASDAITTEETSDPETYYQQLFGGYVAFHPSDWLCEGALYFQRGKDEFGTPISAYMGSLKATYRRQGCFSLNMGYDYLSGDDNPVVPKIGAMGLTLHKKVRGFSTIYGSHHQFYGAMDFFYLKAYYAGYTPGLQNLFIGGTYNPMKNLQLSASYHYLSVASKIHDACMTLGHEVDFTIAYNLMKEVKFSAGYTYMHGTSTLERLQRVENQNNLHWAWLMVTVNPRIFSTKW